MWWAQHCGYFSGYWLWCPLASPDRRAGSHWWDWATNYKSSEDNREHSCPCFLEAKNLNISKNWTEYSVHLYQIYNRVSEQLLRHIYVFVMKNVFNVFGRDNVPVWMTNEKKLSPAQLPWQMRKIFEPDVTRVSHNHMETIWYGKREKKIIALQHSLFPQKEMTFSLHLECCFVNPEHILPYKEHQHNFEKAYFNLCSQAPLIFRVDSLPAFQ